MAIEPINDELTELHEAYVWEVNAAVGNNDDAFVEHLSNEYTERALRVITSPRPPPDTDGRGFSLTYGEETNPRSTSTWTWS